MLQKTIAVEGRPIVLGVTLDPLGDDKLPLTQSERLAEPLLDRKGRATRRTRRLIAIAMG